MTRLAVLATTLLVLMSCTNSPPKKEKVTNIEVSAEAGVEPLQPLKSQYPQTYDVLKRIQEYNAKFGFDTGTYKISANQRGKYGSFSMSYSGQSETPNQNLKTRRAEVNARRRPFHYRRPVVPDGAVDP
ncbi:MAG: hypothetical protein OXN17_19085 [Candidatus Poribacteria bacterium]|nr:hypothetical protein [Candidatus Poribacteria bacterium]MDE0506648.1 hypothetical protein [Candidatus Poribacteria bacterium]